MTEVDTGAFMAIVAGAAVAAAIAAGLSSRLAIPVVVLELLIGVALGPQVLGVVHPDDFIEFFANLGLGMLFFFAGYEIDFERIRGRPLQLAVLGWLITLTLAYSFGAALAAAGLIVSWVYVGSAMATTAIGTLIPILSDAGELRTRFGTYLLAAGAVGEFGPILLITLVFSAGSAIHNAAILVVFVVLAVGAGVLSVRSVGRTWPFFERTIETSSQLAVRSAVVLVFLLATLAANLGLELLLGGFVSGMILRLALQGREVHVFESKLTAVGYGFLIPFFFIVSGAKLDLSSLVSEPAEALKVPLFLGLFLVVRGLPVLLLYGRDLGRRDLRALALLVSTQLPLVVAITTIAVERGDMHPTTAASLVAAAVLSTATFPLLGMGLRRGAPPDDPASGVDPEVLREER